MHDRKFKRISFVSQAMVMIGNQHFKALTQNLSLNGLFIRTNHLIPVGEMTAISLNLPSVSKTVTVDGVVVRNNQYGLAFQFKSLNFDTVFYLKTVINRKSPYR